VLPTMATRP